MIFLLYLLQTLWWAPLLTFSFGYVADIFAVFILKNILQNPAVWASQYQWGSCCRNWKAQVGASWPCDRRHRSELGACYFKWSEGGEGGAGMGDDEVLCQSVEAVVRVACDHSSVNFFICPNSVFLDSFESSLSIVWSLKNFFCFPYATVLSKCVLSTSKCHLYWRGFLAVHPVQISTVDPSSLGFVLLTSNAIAWYWSSSDLPPSAIWSFKLSASFSVLTSLYHIYAGVLPHSMSLSMKDSFWSSIMSNNLPQSAAWLFPNSPSQLIIRLFCPLSTVGLSSLGFLFMKDSFWSFIIVQTIFLSW